MKRRVAFRSFAILLAAVLLMSSTSAYNILVYANQDSVANSLSAIESASTLSETEPNISTQGGELNLNSETEPSVTNVLLYGAEGTEPITYGSQQNPYLIHNAQELLAVNKYVNATTSGDICAINTNKYFALANDIDLGELETLDFVNQAGNAYIVSADPTQSASNIIYINLDGRSHKIFYSESNSEIAVPRYENFALFGYLSESSVISNVVFENINVNVTYGEPKSISVISYRNDGVIENCQVNNCSVTLGASGTDGAYNTNSFNEAVNFYYGVAAAAADNRHTVTGVSVSNFTVNIPGNAANDYVAGVVAQNRGSVISTSISGVKLNIHNGTHYVGGLAGYNALNASVSSSAVSFGSTASDAFDRGNINGGGYVGGLVGYNDGQISNSSVTGTFTSAQTTSTSQNNIYNKATDANAHVRINSTYENRAYFGGITGVNNGTVTKTTVSNLGVYMSASGVSSVTLSGNESYFGGIAAITKGQIEVSVASGSFAADDSGGVATNSAECYAGSIIAYADDTTPDESVKDCYALFKISNPDKPFVGAVVGYGGKTNTAVNCYWSELITGCSTSYFIEDSVEPNPNKPYIIEQTVGNMVSANRAVVMRRNTSVNISTSDIGHSFTKLGTIAQASVTTLGDVKNGSYTNSILVNVPGSNNSLVKKAYNIQFAFPSEVGSDDKQTLVVAANLDVFLTPGKGDPDSITDPFVIESTAMAKYIYLAPYGHYKLAADIAASSAEWKSTVFTGTLDGADNIIAADTNIFSNVIGNRGSSPSVVTGENGLKSTNPELAYTINSRGIISNLNVDLMGNINNAVFGTSYDAAFINIAFTDGDPTPDDGNKTAYEGYISKITGDYKGAFINSAVGNSYIYGCTSDVSVEFEDKVNIGGFIGYLSGKVYIDNCSITSVGAYLNYSNNTNTRAVFVGNPVANNGQIINIAVSAQVIGDGTCYSVFGGAMYPDYAGLNNITWSKNSYSATERDSMLSDLQMHNDIKLWGTDGRKYKESTVSPGSQFSYSVAIPQNVKIFEGAGIADFSVTLVSINTSTGEETTPENEALFTLSNTALEGSTLKVDMSVSADAVNGDNVYVKILHYNTGYVTYAKYTVAQREFEPDSDGYYNIYTPEDLIKLSNLTHPSVTNDNYKTAYSNRDTYNNYAYKLMADIDMSGYTFEPISSVSYPFNGVFDGNDHTISGLTINSDGSNVALFAAAIFETKTITLKGNEVATGIYNLTIDGANITGKSNVAALVATNSYADIDNYKVGLLNLNNITVKNSTITGTASANTGAVVAYSLLATIDINGLVLENVTVTTGYQGSAYFRTNAYRTVGGIGGIIGCVDENKQSALDIKHKITDIDISGLILAGLSTNAGNSVPVEQCYNYAKVNAGSIFGTYQMHNNETGFATIETTIGNAAAEEDYDINIGDFLIMSSGMTGGLIGSSNVAIIINKVNVYGTNDGSSKILSDTELYIGGIAGYIGSYEYIDGNGSLAADTTDVNQALANSYGQINDSIVENVTIMATDEAIVEPDNQLERNVAVGGIAGAINGPQEGATISNCTVKNSHIEGTVVGGIVGSNIQRQIQDSSVSISLESKNVINISGSNVINCLVTTPGVEVTEGNKTVKKCYPVFEMADTSESGYATYGVTYGVGGIVGTNRRSEFAFANEFIINNCEVDGNTDIKNYIPYQKSIDDNTGYNISTRAATGGLVGSLYASQPYYGVSNVELNNNYVAADILSEANPPARDEDDCLFGDSYYVTNNEYDNVVAGSGGFIGMISGSNQWDKSFSAGLQCINITNGVFSGNIVSYNGIGGVVGAIVTSMQIDLYNSVAYTLENFISNIAITGTLKSKADTSQMVRGGMVIGHAFYRLSSDTSSLYDENGIIVFENEGEQGSAKTAFNNIYFSSFGVDGLAFPFIGFYGAYKDGSDYEGDGYSYANPVSEYYKQSMLECYYDTNLCSDNLTVQMSDVETDVPYTVPNGDQAAPEEYRGSFTFDSAKSHWKSSNSGQASISSSNYDVLTVTPKNISPSPVKISINYVGTIAGRTVELPVGFLFTSTAQTPLDYVVYNGEKYYIITGPADFSIIASDANENYDDDNALKANYWIYNDINFNSDGAFAENYPDGFPAIGTKEKPFAGSISSMPAGTYTSENGEEYTSNGEIHTISGIGQFKPTTVENDIVVAGLVGYAQNASFTNFKLADVSFIAPTDGSALKVNYAAVVAAIAVGSLNSNNVVVQNATVSGAEYSGGLFGGFFSGSASGDESALNITGSKLEGTRNENTYSNNIVGKKGAAGIVVHSDQSSATINGVEVSGALISQQADGTPDYTYYDNGAAGVSLAYAGEIVGGSVINSKIKGEIAAGAVVRSYTSKTANTFESADTKSGTNGVTSIGASKLQISDLDILGTTIEGTAVFMSATYATDNNRMVASGGILARLDLHTGAGSSMYEIKNCSLDSETMVTAPYGAGGVLGTYEMYPGNVSAVNTYAYGITIDGCRVAATVQTTATTSDTIVSKSNLKNYQNTGCGGIVGYLANFAPVTKTNIKNCSVTGTISANSTMGGIIGALWTNSATLANVRDAMRFDKMSSHFTENCVVSAEFINATTKTNAFSKDYTPATGIVVGLVYNAAQSTSHVYGSNNSFDSGGLTNQPFFNIYYSAYKYTMGNTYLFGVVNPSASAMYSLNYSTKYDYSCYTNYIYDVNYYDSSNSVNCEVDPSSHALTSTEKGRITPPEKNDENGVFIVDYRIAQTGFVFNLNDLGFNTATDAASLNYSFSAGASANPSAGFTLNTTLGAGTGADKSVADFVGIEVNNSKVEVTYSGNEYTVRAKEVLTKSAPFDLIFVYSNGLELAIPFRIEVSSSDYYYVEENGAKTYYVFNASTLYSTMEVAGPNDKIVQAFDVFCTLDNQSIAQAVNDYTAGVTISSVYGAELTSAIANTMHPNPNYEPGIDDELDITILKYLGTTESEFGSLPLSRLVKEIGLVEFGAYKQRYDYTLYTNPNPFAGTYEVLEAQTGESVNRGLSSTDYPKYAIYGMELHSVNVTAQGEDALSAGMFNALAGATISDITFINPRIEVVASKSADNYVGVLSGTANGASISNVRVVNTDLADKTNAYVMSLRQMTAASTCVGGIVGAAYTGTTISGCQVNGLDVVGSSIAANITKTLKTVNAGAICGLSEVGVTNPAVENSRVLVGHNDRYRTSYLAYAGGVAGKISGTVSGAVINNVVLRDCDCDVVSDGNGGYSGTYSAQDGNHSLVGDRIGGISGYGYGAFSVTDANLTDVDITAFDIAGGIVAELENSADTSVSVSGSILDGVDVRVLSSAVVASSASLREFYNTAGGIVGLVRNIGAINVSNTDVIGYIGTYSYDNLGKDAAAGGIIGYITEELTSFDGIGISSVSVQGEVSGFRSNKEAETVQQYLGAAGGFIGKVYSTAVRTLATPMVSDSVMSALVNLYTASTGDKADAAPADPANSPSTHVGKLLGTLVSTADGTNLAKSATDITSCFSNIFISSYPQDIVLFGCQDFYTNQNFGTDGICTDVNQTYDSESNEYDNTLKIGLEGDMSSDPNADTYSSLAIIAVNGSNASASRFFKLGQDNIAVTDGRIISFDPAAGAEILLSDDSESNTAVAIGNENSNYYLSFTGLNEGSAGEVSVSYTYGLRVGARFIATDIQGTGAETDPFQVTKPIHLVVIRSLRDAYYKQMNDIDLAAQYGYSEDVSEPLWADDKGFEPIGTQASPFRGSYDGQGYAITNLFISRKNNNYIGFFGSIAGTADSHAVVKNLHIEIASELSVSKNPEKLSTKTVLTGGVIGKNYVGGLAGYSSDADIINCSVVKGDVIGNTAVGGLVGGTRNTTLISCFTSTTSSSYNNQNNDASTKNVGALVGIVNSTTNINNSFTLGYASVGVNSDRNYGAAGGLVGYVSSGVSLTVDNAYVGATVSDYRGNVYNGVYYKGLVIGSADLNSTVTVSNMFISAPSALSYADNIAINPVLGSYKGAAIGENVRYDSAMLGTFSNATSKTTETSVTASSFSFEGITIGTSADEDSYTDAYAALAKISLTVDPQEVEDREGKSYVGGLFYPVRFSESGWKLTSSVMDMTDTVPYPEGMDVGFYGNGENKGTDLLFEDTNEAGESYTAVHLNVFRDDVGKNVFSEDVDEDVYGSRYSNGEIFYDCKMPYFTVEKQMDGTSFELYRKFVYPVQVRYDETVNIRTYPLSTERQLTALSVPESSGKFADFKLGLCYTLIEDIAITRENFMPIKGFTGNFDGNNNSITNLTINASSNDNVGLFATLSTGSVKDLILVVNSVVGQNNVGALVGAIASENNSAVSITNCSVIGTDSEAFVQGNENVGGLIGKAEYKAGSAISGSSSSVEVRGSNIAGGLAGYCELPIDNCYAVGNVNANIVSTSSGVCGVGGLVGVYTNASAKTEFKYSFASGAVEISSASYNTANGYGIGGLVGYVGNNLDIKAVFSSGSVRYCYDDSGENSITDLAPCANVTLGIGGLIGIQGSKIVNVYSSASIAARVGDVTGAVNVGIGGVTGIAKSDLETAYSSGSTLGLTATNITEENAAGYNYGVGGVIGIVPSGISGVNLFFDLNVSVVDDAVGKALGSTSNTGSRTTVQMTNGSLAEGSQLGNEFGYTDGAYPYLKTFFNEDVSRTIQFNALLSIVAIQLNELDETAKNGEGISMAMTIPTGIEHNGVTYTYGFEADNTHGGSATSIVDETTNLLSVQRTSNTKEQANFLITISTVGGKENDANGVVYSTIANRQLSRVCAQMLGTEAYPYLVASVSDLEHVAMSNQELANCPTDSYYRQWNAPLNENGTVATGVVHYRMMGPIDIAQDYGRKFASVADAEPSSLTNGYVFDGNGYELRQLKSSLASTLDADSTIRNVKLVGVDFGSDESLVGSLKGEVNGVTLNGKATGSNVAGVAQTIGESGKVYGTVSNLSYIGAEQNNVAGIAITNNGLVELSASVGSFGSSESSVNGANNMGAMVGTNNGTIKNSFTMGDIILSAPVGVVSGFVGTNNGTVENCYTRCNIMASGVDTAPSIGSFAAVNTGSVNGCFASGLFNVAGEKASDIKTVFIGTNSGTVTESAFDKQMGGSSFKNDYWLAEHTQELISLANHPSLKDSAYTVDTPPSDSTGTAVYSDEYPQLTAILSTYAVDESGAETADSRMYRTLRSYSAISAATAEVTNDNYIDKLAADSETAISRDFTWVSSNASAGVPQSNVSNNITNRYFKAKADGVNQNTKLYTVVAVDDYYNTGEKINYTFNLYLSVKDGQHPNFAGGNGTVDAPFRISTPEQVVALSFYGNNSANNFEVINDIDMADADWSSYITVFRGNLNGGGFALYNTTINGDNGALMGRIEGGTVKNLGLSGINVNYSGNGAAGMLAGSVVNGATIENCVAVGTVEATNSFSVGGLVGSTDGATVISGCVVSGRVTGAGSDGSNNPKVGGVVGQAGDETSVSNSLCTALVSGGPNSVVGGIVGSGPNENGAVEINNTVFAGNVDSTTANNLIAVGSVNGANNYFDKLFSTTEEGGTPATTHYLTSGGNVADMLGASMERFDGFTSYPVPVEFVGSGYSEVFINTVKLASGKINLASGVSAGSVTAFTSVSAPAGLSANLSVTVQGDGSDYISGSDNSYTVNTGSLPLNQKLNGTITYKLNNTAAARYVDFTLGKIVNKITYEITGLSGEKSILSVVTGSGNTATAVTAFDSTGSGTLCKEMILDYTIESGKAKIFSVDSKLPEGYKQGTVSVEFLKGTTSVHTTGVETSADGSCDVVISDSIGNFDNIKITVSAVADNQNWGIHKLIGLFS